MPGIDWNLSPPKWLQDAGTWQDTGGLQALQIGLNAAQNQQRIDLATEKAKTDYEMQKVQMASEGYKLQAMRDEQAAWLKDAPVVANLWSMTPQQLISTPAPVTSKQGSALVERLKVQAGIDLAKTTTAKDQNDFRIGMQPLSAADRSRILAMPSSPSGPTADQWGELNKARTAMGLFPSGVKQSELAGQASVPGKLASDLNDAIQRGDYSTVAIISGQIDKMQKEAQGGTVREQKQLDMAERLKSMGDMEGYNAMRKVAFHQFGSGDAGLEKHINILQGKAETLDAQIAQAQAEFDANPQDMTLKTKLLGKQKAREVYQNAIESLTPPPEGWVKTSGGTALKPKLPTGAPIQSSPLNFNDFQKWREQQGQSQEQPQDQP